MPIEIELVAALPAGSKCEDDSRIPDVANIDLYGFERNLTHNGVLQSTVRDGTPEGEDPISVTEAVQETDHALQAALSEAATARDRAEAAARAMSEFVTTVSHEIRTPINAIVATAEVLELADPAALTPDQRMLLKRIHLSARYLQRLIADLLDLERLKQQRSTVRRQKAAAWTAVRTAVVVVQPQAAEKNINVLAECGNTVRYIGDPERTEQVLVNLLNNAIKFTPPGGRVTLRCLNVRGNGGPRARFVVEDNGIGIAADRLDEVFKPFVQLGDTSTRTHDGTGLGLSISRHLAELMQGGLTVQSEVGRGSRFTLELPAPAGAQ